MATASVCSSPSARTDGVICLALRRNEAYSGQQVVTFQIGFRRHFRPPESIGAPALALGLGNTIATGLRLRTRRFATVEAATCPAWLGSDLAAAAGPSLGSTKAPALTPVWRCLIGTETRAVWGVVCG